MAKISLKKDYTDGNVLYGKDLNPNFETIETALNNNDDTQSGINEEVNSNLAQLNSDVTQIKSDIVDIQGDITNIDSDITSGDNATLSAAQTYVDTKLQGYAETSDLPTSTSDLINDSGFVTAEDVPTKISELENDDHTVKDENYVHTDNNFSNTDKSKLDGLSNYELPTASDTVLGGIKVGDNLEITSDGVLNALGGGLTTLVGTEENPIALDTLTEAGIYHVSGYMKNNSDYGGIGEVVSKHDRILLVVRTGSDNRHISQLYYEGSPYKFRWYQRIGDIYTGMNSSFNAIDLVTQVDDSALGDTGGIITEYSLLAYIGKLTDLETTDKSNIVAAINEALESGGGGGGSGEDGATFTPSVSEDGTLSWTNDKGLPNPDPVNIKGPQGDPGEDGTDGANGQDGNDGTNGENGATFTPNVSDNGDLSWTNDKNLQNPTTVNIKGAKGDKGDKGDTGDTGATGPANTLSIGTVTSGDNASASITGTAPNQTLNLTLPKASSLISQTTLEHDTGVGDTINVSGYPPIVVNGLDINNGDSFEVIISGVVTGSGEISLLFNDTPYLTNNSLEPQIRNNNGTLGTLRLGTALFVNNGGEFILKGNYTYVDGMVAGITEYAELQSGKFIIAPTFTDISTQSQITKLSIEDTSYSAGNLTFKEGTIIKVYKK